MNAKLIILVSLMLIGGAFARPATAQNHVLQSDDGVFSFAASAGVLALEGREHVFDVSGSTNNLSLLIWQSVSPMISANVSTRFDTGWTLKAEGRVASSGWGYMEDYDWDPNFRPSFDFNDWTDRSQSPNTNLDWFAEGSIAIGQNLATGPGTVLNVNAGLAYTDVQWTAVGGSYIYSNAGFRDSTGTFPNDPAATYRQQIPSAFVGLDATMLRGPFTFELGARGGMAFLHKATDWHWMRTPPLRFESEFNPALTAGARARAAMDVGDQLDVFVEGRVDKMFLARSDQLVYNINTGAFVSGASDAQGGELLSGSISAGLKGKF